MQRFIIEVETVGNCQVINLELELEKHLKNMRGSGLFHLFVPGSTAGITTLEYERGLVKHDLAAALQRLIPDNIPYEHEATWNDDNGHSHVRAALFGPDLTVPFADGQLLTGEWQQVVLVDFDTRPRRRQIIVTVIQ